MVNTRCDHRPAPPGVDADQKQRAPDTHKAQQPVWVQRLVKHPQAEQKLQARQDVLHHTQSGQLQLARAGGKQQQRQSRQGPGQQELTQFSQIPAQFGRNRRQIYRKSLI